MKKIIIYSLLAIVIFFIFLLYGPINNFRTFLITTSMTTQKHQYIAEFFYSNKTINKVLSENKVEETKEITNPKLIKIKKYDKDKIYRLIRIHGVGYKGYLVLIYHPENVSLVTSEHFGIEGEKITSVGKRKKAKVVINAGGFYDPNWKGNGAIPHGVVINKGKIISEYKDAGVGGGFIGFNKDNKLILGKMSLEKAQTMNYRDAIEFGPFLVINGKKTKIKGNGGWGVAPRTAIGQRKDGTVIFLVVDGRISSSIGVTMDEVADIMLKYKAINAANLDGGSSSELLIDSKIINNPTGGGVDNLRKMPLYWVLK